MLCVCICMCVCVYMQMDDTIGRVPNTAKNTLEGDEGKDQNPVCN